MAINLGTIIQDLQALRAQGRVPTTSPGSLTEEGLGALIHIWQTRPARGPNQGGRPGARLDQATWGRYLSDLQGFLESSSLASGPMTRGSFLVAPDFGYPPPLWPPSLDEVVEGVPTQPEGGVDDEQE